MGQDFRLDGFLSDLSQTYSQHLSLFAIIVVTLFILILASIKLLLQVT